MQNVATSCVPPVHSHCNAIREARRKTFTNLAISFSLSIIHLSPAGTNSDTRPSTTAPATADPDSEPSPKGWIFILEERRKLVRSKSSNLGRSCLGQRCKQRRNRPFKLAQASKHLVVLHHAEASSIRIAIPGCIAGCSSNAPQHVSQLCDFSVSFHVSPRSLKSFIWSRSNCLPR